MISLSPVMWLGNELGPMSRRCSPRVPVLLLLAVGGLLAGCGKEGGSPPDAQVQALQLKSELDRTKNKLAATQKEISAKDDALVLAKEETEAVKKQVTEKEKALMERESQIRALQDQLTAIKKSEPFVFAEASKLVPQGFTTSALGRYQQFVKDFPKSPLVTDANRAIAALTVTAPRDAKARAAMVDPKAPERDFQNKFAEGNMTPQDLAPVLKGKSLVEVLRLLGAPNRTYRDGTELGYVDKVTDPITGERATLVVAFDEGQTVSTLRVGYTGRPMKP
jgi:hypothetical protein